MRLSFEHDADTLKVLGPLEIQHADAARDAFKAALSETKELIVNLQGLTSCDPAGAQLIWSFWSTAANAGLKVEIQQAPPCVHECWAALGLKQECFDLSTR